MAYTTIDDPSAHFQVKTYTGNSGVQFVTNDGNSDLQPDFVWIKNRTVAYSHQLYDSSRGTTKALFSNAANAETTVSNGLVTFNTDGFGVNSAAAVNENELVAWQWKANGGTTSSNTDGSITSTVQANQDAGFSIVQYTGTGTAATIGHGLGVAPKWIVIKNRNNSGGTNWVVYHQELTSNQYNLILNSNAAQSNSVGYFNSTSPTSSVFSIKGGSDDVNNTTGNDYLAYCFAEKQGYSKFGKYVGNGSTNGVFVYTGFKPAFILVKEISSATSWGIWDNKRSPSNAADKLLLPNSADAEYTGSPYSLDILSNGFKLRTTDGAWNGTADYYIYMAFAENPFTTSTGIPTTAR